MSNNQTILANIDRMNRELDETSHPALYGPAPFWQDASVLHRELLQSWGFERFKRSINFEFNQWGITNLKNRQLRFVFRQLIKRKRFPYVALLSRSRSLDDAAWDVPHRHSPNYNPDTCKRSLFAYKLFVGLLWQTALSVDRIGALHSCDEPLTGDPLEIRYRGKLITQDLAMSCIELNTIAKHLDLHQLACIGELGAGYGRLAYLATTLLPRVQYSIFDIPPALAISQHYLATVLGHDQVAHCTDCVPNLSREISSHPRVVASLAHQLEVVPDNHFDLMINISSLDEMPFDQVRNYLELMDRKCRGWVYLKGYRSRKGTDPDRPIGVSQFPYPDHWSLIFHGQDATHPKFIERIYRVSSP